MDLESRPQIGPVKLTLTGAQDNKDPDDDFRWAKKPAGACSTVSSWQSSGSTVTLAYNKSSDEWNTAHKICVRIGDDEVDHATAEQVVLTFAASNDDASQNTDYDTGFAPSSARPGSAWTPAWSRSVTAPASAVSATYTITITN